MMRYYIDFKSTGKEITRQRKKHAMSVSALSDMLGITKQAVYKWEKGVTIPSTDNLYAMSLIFGCHMDDLLKGGKTHASNML